MNARVLVVVVLVLNGQAAPRPRTLTPAPLDIGTPFAHVSAIGELPDGRLLVTDATSPAVHLLDPKTGRSEVLGAPGAGDGQYVQPGGVYHGPDGTRLILDRGMKRVLVVSPAGVITGNYSIAIKGVTSASDADVDHERIDGQRLAYFVEGADFALALRGGQPPKAVDLVRFDAATQTREVVTTLRIPEAQAIPVGDNTVITRQVIGSPADGFGVAPDGRVAVVRAAPYRVEWYTVGGAVTPGPTIDYTPVVMTEADRDAARQLAGQVSVGMMGDAQTSSSSRIRFADVKPPFAPDDVRVSPDGRVWVMRSRVHGSATVVYDVFDGVGARVDRVALPDGSRVIGFGRAAVFVRQDSAEGSPALRKYEVK